MRTRREAPNWLAAQLRRPCDRYNSCSLTLTDLLNFTAKKEASDLHLKPMRPPLLRIKGRLIPVNTEALQPAELEKMLLEILTAAQRAAARAEPGRGHRLRPARAWPGSGRTSTSSAGPCRPPSGGSPSRSAGRASSGCPEIVETFSRIPAGLVLVTGPTGSGKSTTLAAIMHSVIETRPVHIVTIEDPIEYLFPAGKAAVSQREVGTDTPSFPEALKNLMRQDPDVIMVGEMREWQTIQTAITAAETGHLVFSTLHTNSAGQSIDRIIDSCPPSQQQQFRLAARAGAARRSSR